MKLSNHWFDASLSQFTLNDLMRQSFGGSPWVLWGLVHFIEEHCYPQHGGGALAVSQKESEAQGLPPRLDCPKTHCMRRTYLAMKSQRNFIRALDGMGFSSRSSMKTVNYYLFHPWIHPNNVSYWCRNKLNSSARECHSSTSSLQGFILSGLVAWLLGWMMARYRLAPLARWPQRFRHRGFPNCIPWHPILPPDYPDDE